MSTPTARDAAAATAAALAVKVASALAAALAPVLLVLLLVAAIFGPPANEAASGTLRYGVSALARKDIPAGYLRLYQQAARRYGIDWAILAAIGKVETDHGRSHAPGVRSGQNSYGCCAGPMQFNNNFGRGGGTWAAYAVDGNGDGLTDIYDPADAIPAAANYLAALGGRADPRRAIFGYNHAWWYVTRVETWAQRYRGDLQTAPDLPVDVGRLAWPVRGPIVSPFGPRQGRMH
ncbi:MAG: lytic murein transglycosylase [Solirubrobacteraceae bacterium]